MDYVLEIKEDTEMRLLSKPELVLFSFLCIIVLWFFQKAQIIAPWNYKNIHKGH